MPSGYLHQRCAEQALARAGFPPAERWSFVLGAQGPDPLFVLGMFPLGLSSKPSKLGNLLHESRTGAFLCALARGAAASGAVEQAYAMGFLTHYALDSTVHPFVYPHSFDARGKYHSSLHMRLEKRWDALYYRKDGYPGVPALMPGAEETRPFWPQIAALWAGAIREVYPEQGVTDLMVLSALSDTAKACKLTYSPRGIKYAACWLLERLIGKPGLATSQMVPRFLGRADLTNAAHAEWIDPSDSARRTESLEELYERAVCRAVELLKAATAFYNGEIGEDKLKTVIGNLGYDTGKPSKP